MPDDQRTNLAGTIVTLYRNHWRLFWRIMMPVAIIAPDLAQIRDALSPLKFLSRFIGGDIEVVLPELLNPLVTVVILIVKVLIATFLVPIWAILTTLLYLERVDVKPNALKEAI